jgi:hypothetical protein
MNEESAPALSLFIPAATLVNPIFFHILPTVIEKRTRQASIPQALSLKSL